MELEYVISECDECGTKNKRTYLITTKTNYSLTFCESCLDELTKKLNDYQADKWLKEETE
jgi:hypothetical protein